MGPKSGKRAQTSSNIATTFPILVQNRSKVSQNGSNLAFSLLIVIDQSIYYGNKPYRLFQDVFYRTKAARHDLSNYVKHEPKHYLDIDLIFEIILAVTKRMQIKKFESKIIIPSKVIANDDRR